MGDALSVPFIVLVLSYDHFHYISSFCLSDLVGFLLLTLNRSLLFQLGEFSASCTWLLKGLSLIFGSKQLGFIHVFVNRPFPVYSSEQRHQKLTLSLRKFSDLYRRVSTSCNYVCYNWTGIWKEAIQSKNITFVSL